MSMCDVEFQALQGCDSADLKLVEIQHLSEIARVEGPHFGGFLKTVWLDSIGIQRYPASRKFPTSEMAAQTSKSD